MAEPVIPPLPDKSRAAIQVAYATFRERLMTAARSWEAGDDEAGSPDAIRDLIGAVYSAGYDDGADDAMRMLGAVIDPGRNIQSMEEPKADG